MTADSKKHCAFCFGTTDVARPGDGVRLRVSNDGSPSCQELYAHTGCLAELLDERVPFLLDEFD